MKNCLVAQSGGPTCAINASLAGVIYAVKASKEYDTIYGSLNGITGMIEQRYLNLSEIFEKDEAIDTLKKSPSMYLGSCRFKLPTIEEDETIYNTIFEFFAQLNIEAFFYIGGNDSMDTVAKLSKYGASIKSSVRIIGVPKTVDNDLVEIDHTPGFGSAAKYVATSMLEMAHDTAIYPLKSVTIVEIMGRDAGWLTASAALARTEYSNAPQLIYLPEAAFDTEKFLDDVRDLLQQRNSVLIAISEGIRDKDGNYISASESSVDNFGHAQLAGAGKALEHLVANEIGVKVRSVELNIPQRAASHMASKTDLDESFALGENAVSLAETGENGVMSTLKRTSNSPYQVEYGKGDIQKIANEVKAVPREWINEAGNDVTDEMVEYLRPLIMGEVSLSYENGLPSYMPISHLSKK